MARTAKQVAAQHKASIASAAARKKRTQQKAISAAKKLGGQRKASATRARNANAAVPDDVYKAIMRGERAPNSYKPKKGKK